LYPTYKAITSRIKENERAEELATQIEGRFPGTFLPWFLEITLPWFLVLQRISNIWNSTADPKISSQT
jgi:hypothetical protein